MAKLRNEGNVLFNDALNTFYLRLYGIRHMVKNHSDSERGNPLPPHRLLFSISSQGSFICIIPRPLLHQSLEWEIAQWVHPMKDRSADPANWNVFTCINELARPHTKASVYSFEQLQAGHPLVSLKALVWAPVIPGTGAGGTFRIYHPANKSAD